MLDKADWSMQAKYYDRYRHNPETATWHMERGPCFADDGLTLIIPSDWYNKEAARFWKSVGFHYQGDDGTYWTRDTRQPHHGKVFTPAAWLESARRKYAEFWSVLAQRKWIIP